jgi:PPOX class probable F420-dependent enzyme
VAGRRVAGRDKTGSMEDTPPQWLPRLRADGGGHPPASLPVTFGLRPGLDRPVHDFLTRQSAGVLVTTRPDGNVRQSVVYFALDGDRLLISTEPGHAKAKDVQRTGRASLCVIGGASPYPSVTLEGPARIRATVRAAPSSSARTDSSPGTPTRPPTRRPSCPKPCRRSSARGRTHGFKVALMTAGREDLIEYRSGGKSRR